MREFGRREKKGEEKKRLSLISQAYFGTWSKAFASQEVCSVSNKRWSERGAKSRGAASRSQKGRGECPPGGLVAGRGGSGDARGFTMAFEECHVIIELAFMRTARQEAPPPGPPHSGAKSKNKVQNNIQNAILKLFRITSFFQNVQN